MNLNKLVPRLTISAKLTVAFALLTVVPLVLVGAVATYMAVERLRRNAVASLEYDLELVRVRVSRSIHEVEQHLTYLSEAFIEPTLREAPPMSQEEARGYAESFLRADSSAVLRVRAFDADGELQFGAGWGAEVGAGVGSVASGLLYVWAAEHAPEKSRLLIPVELRASNSGAADVAVIPAVAVVQPYRDDAGGLLGVAVAEAEAAVLFAGLEFASPGLVGTTGLVGLDGLYLYHSERKRDWTSLLAPAGGVNLTADFDEAVVRSILSGDSGTVRSGDGEIVSYRQLAVAGGGVPLALFRAVPLSAIGGPVRSFVLINGVIGLSILGLVLGIASIAARQITKPIYSLQRAARSLALHGQSTDLEIETNDELEDLARDFSVMAEVVVAHRRDLETTVQARTRALELTKAELSEIITNSADAIIGLDAEGYVRLWNDGAVALFGYESGEAQGRQIESLIGGPGTGSEAESAYIGRRLRDTGSVVNLRTTRRPKNGEPFSVSLTQTSITDVDGNVVGSSLIIRDDRLQHMMEEQMRRSERLAAVSIMAAGLAHEINNPLAVLGNRIEVMQREARADGASDRLQRDFAVLGQHVERLRSITTDLLAFAREEQDEPKPVVLDDVIGRVVRLLDRSFATKGVSLLVARDESVPAPVGNEKAIETVFVNLLLNALHATDAGGSVEIGASTPPGRLDAVEVAVADTGRGIPDELRSRIFEPFFTTKGGNGGTGLGLTVCRAILERHGGRITVDDNVGGGSRFVVTLPVRTNAS